MWRFDVCYCVLHFHYNLDIIADLNAKFIESQILRIQYCHVYENCVLWKYKCRRNFKDTVLLNSSKCMFPNIWEWLKDCIAFLWVGSWDYISGQEKRYTFLKEIKSMGVRKHQFASFYGGILSWRRLFQKISISS